MFVHKSGFRHEPQICCGQKVCSKPMHALNPLKLMNMFATDFSLRPEWSLVLISIPAGFPSGAQNGSRNGIKAQPWSYPGPFRRRSSFLSRRPVQRKSKCSLSCIVRDRVCQSALDLFLRDIEIGSQTVFGIGNVKDLSHFVISPNPRGQPNRHRRGLAAQALESLSAR